MDGFIQRGLYWPVYTDKLMALGKYPLCQLRNWEAFIPLEKQMKNMKYRKTGTPEVTIDY